MIIPSNETCRQHAACRFMSAYERRLCNEEKMDKHSNGGCTLVQAIDRRLPGPVSQTCMLGGAYPAMWPQLIYHTEAWRGLMVEPRLLRQWWTCAEGGGPMEPSADINFVQTVAHPTKISIFKTRSYLSDQLDTAMVLRIEIVYFT